jgi:hypothetical protein
MHQSIQRRFLHLIHVTHVSRQQSLELYIDPMKKSQKCEQMRSANSPVCATARHLFVFDTSKTSSAVDLRGYMPSISHEYCSYVLCVYLRCNTYLSHDSCTNRFSVVFYTWYMWHMSAVDNRWSCTSIAGIIWNLRQKNRDRNFLRNFFTFFWLSPKLFWYALTCVTSVHVHRRNFCCRTRICYQNRLKVNHMICVDRNRWTKSSHSNNVR